MDGEIEIGDFYWSESSLESGLRLFGGRILISFLHTQIVPT